MKRLSFRRFSIALALYLLSFTVASAAEVLKIVINDAIHPITDEFVGRALTDAQNRHADALLIEINTPGRTRRPRLATSSKKFWHLPLPVVIYVTPSGSRAASAGFFILESADVAAMAPGTNTGAAHPVTLGGEKMDDVMKQKMENDAAALMRSVADKRGRNVQLAESAVRESKSFTDQEALSQKSDGLLSPQVKKICFARWKARRSSVSTAKPSPSTFRASQ